MLSRILNFIRARLPGKYEHLAKKALERVRITLKDDYFVDIGHPRLVIVGEGHREDERMVSTGAILHVLHAYLEEIQNHRTIPKDHVIIYHEGIESLYPAAEHILESSALRSVLNAFGHKIRQAKDTWERIRILSDFLHRLAKLNEVERLLLTAPLDALGPESKAYIFNSIIGEKLGLNIVPEENIPFYSLQAPRPEELVQLEQWGGIGKGFVFTWFLHRLQTDVLSPLGLELFRLHAVEKPRDRELHKQIVEEVFKPAESQEHAMLKEQLKKVEPWVAAERTWKMLKRGVALLKEGHPMVVLVVGAYHAGVSSGKRRTIARRPLEEIRQELGGKPPTIIYAKELDPERLFKSLHREIREPR